MPVVQAKPASLERIRPGVETVPQRRRSRGSLLIVALQACVLTGAISTFRIEGPAFARLMQICLAGFFVHHFLPRRWQLRFFVGLSVFCTVLVLCGDPIQWRAGLVRSA